MRTVTTTEELQAAVAEGVEIREIEVVPATVAATPEELAAARAEGRAQAIAEAVAAERARVVTIKRLAGKSTKELVETAISSGMAPGTFATMLLHEMQRADAPRA